MKPSKLFVKPARPGMNLRHPVSGLLPDKGKRWIDDAFTRRRIADGGISIATQGTAELEGHVDLELCAAPHGGE
jgi:hypothetical protein